MAGRGGGRRGEVSSAAGRSMPPTKSPDLHRESDRIHRGSLIQVLPALGNPAGLILNPSVVPGRPD